MDNRNLTLYYTNIDTNLSPIIRESYINLVSLERKEKIRRFHNNDDKKRALYGAIMIRGLLQEIYGINTMKYTLKMNEYGKPYFKEMSTPHFNISHSGNYILCGFHEKELGIDIEKINTYHESIAHNYFTKQEYITLCQMPQSERTKLFYTYWTLKESYVKYLGKGLSVPLNSFSFCKKEHKYFLEYSKYEQNVRHFCELFKDEYMIAVTCSQNVEKISIEYKNILDFQHILSS